MYNHNLGFKLILPKVKRYTIIITFQVNRILSFHKLTFIHTKTPATSDPDLKSSIQTLELFNKSSVVNFTVDEILSELGNESEIHNGSILLFPPIDKQNLSPSRPNAAFKYSSLICHGKEQEERREEICTTGLSEGFKEFKSRRLISVEARKEPRFFNYRVSHINKTNNSSSNKNKMPPSPNHLSSETTVMRKINIPDSSSGAYFPNSLMSVNNVYNFDAHPWSKNTILVAGVYD